MNEEQLAIVENAVKDILAAVGDDPNRPGLVETPKRVAKMYAEVFSSLSQREYDNVKIFDTTTDAGIVVVKDIQFYSMCEHHLLPFFGKVHVAYVPQNGKVIGLSKIPRMVDFAARRPSLQEGLTAMVADLLEEHVDPAGVAVIAEAEHMCMAMRGVRKEHSMTYTSVYRGIFKDDHHLRDEFLRQLH